MTDLLGAVDSAAGTVHLERRLAATFLAAWEAPASRYAATGPTP